MQVRLGDMFEVRSEKNPVFVTTNSTVTKNGLVMGAGAALQATELFPDLRKYFALVIRGRSFYGYLLPEVHSYIGAFQTKNHFSEPSRPFLVRKSAETFVKYLRSLPEEITVHMNFPGIGRGGLWIRDVWDVIHPLWKPYNICVWVNEKGQFDEVSELMGF